jgi:hypothetical protein
MVPIDQIRRLEYAVREAQAALDRAHAENASAELKWRQMVRQAEQSVAQGKSCRFPLRVDPGFPLRTDPA